MKTQFGEKTDKGLVRKQNEDAMDKAFDSPNGDIYVVCDGMGGHAGGVEASNLAVKNILEYLKKEKYQNIVLALEQAIQFANEQVYLTAQNDPSLKGMGTTVTVLVMKDNKFYYAHVGDSRIYLLHENKLYRITKDHSFVQKLVDQGTITDEEAETHPQKNRLLKALGVAGNVEVEVCESPIMPQAGDMFMLCSDGLSGMVPDPTMRQLLIDKKNTVQQKAEQLVDFAKKGGGKDNITVQLVEIEQSEYAETNQFQHFTPLNQLNIDEERTTGDLKNSQTANTEEIRNNATENNEETNNNGFFNQPQNRKFLLGGLVVVVLALLIAGYFTLFGSKKYRVEIHALADGAIIEDARYTSDNFDEAKKYLMDYTSKNTNTYGILQKKNNDGEYVEDFSTKPLAENEKTEHLVIEGDTWESIYEQYGVCPEQIQRVEANRAAIGPEKEPVVGKTLIIPKKYSKIPDLNPDNYINYTNYECEAFAEEEKPEVNNTPDNETDNDLDVVRDEERRQNLQQNATRLQNSIDSLDTEIAAMQDTLEQKKAKVATVKAEKEEIEEELLTLNPTEQTRRNQLNDERTAKEAELEKANEEVGRLNGKIEQAKATKVELETELANTKAELETTATEQAADGSGGD